MLLRSIGEQAERLRARSLAGLPPPALWEEVMSERRGQWREMLGIGRNRVQCPLEAEVTSRHDGAGFRVENLSFQPVAGQYIAANLWLPQPLPAVPAPCVIYLCGHSQLAKWHYQAHPRWLATHGYVCLSLDTIETNECRGDHHGVYTRHAWHWLSQGYTPAGVEVEIARRALDYLTTRPEADAARCGLTGISGGATMSLYAAAADERFAAVAPHCIAGTLAENLARRGVDGHCDCAFWVNLARWEVADVAALVAPRPLLFSFASGDMLCRPEPMRELANQLRPIWTGLGAEQALAISEDVAHHAYTPLICQRIFGWFDRYLKGGTGEVPLSEVFPFSSPTTPDERDFLPQETLTVFRPGHPPDEQRMQQVDRTFIPVPERPALPARAADWAACRDERLARLRATTFRQLPDPTSIVDGHIEPLGRWSGERCVQVRFAADPGLEIRCQVALPEPPPAPLAVLLAPCREEAAKCTLLEGAGIAETSGHGFARGTVYVRGTGDTSPGPGLKWTVRRMYPLLGCTLPERQTADLVRAVTLARRQLGAERVALYGEGAMAARTIYAALFAEVDELVLAQPVGSHWNAGPEYPAVLQVGDLPENLALFAPRRITFVTVIPEAYRWVVQLYERIGCADAIRTVPNLAAWRPTPIGNAP